MSIDKEQLIEHTAARYVADGMNPDAALRHAEHYATICEIAERAPKQTGEDIRAMLANAFVEGR